jgi:pyruvate dehydrogenase E1 component alpha subunit
LEEYKEKDPINQVLKTITDNNWATNEEIEHINEKVRLEVEDSVKFAEESPYPDDNELYKDIYVQEDYPYITD